MTKHAFLLFAFAAVLPLHAEVKVLKGFTLIDGTGKAAQPNSAMIVDNGKITWVGAAASVKAPAGAQTIDLAGKFVMPGLINLHGHLGATKDMVQDEKLLTQDNVEHDLKTYASYGVTTMQSLGTDKDFVLSMRDKQRATGRPGEARIYTAGHGFVFKGAYGGLAGVNETVATPQDVQKQIDHLVAQKVDLIKFWLDDHLGLQKPKMPYNIADAIIADAHKANKNVVAHIFYLDDAKELASHGINGFAHMVRDKPVDQALIDSMKKNDTWQLAATLTREASLFAYGKTPAFIDDPFFTRGVSQKDLQVLRSPEFQKTQTADPHFSHYPEYLETAKKNFKKLVDSGVKYGFGTDAGPPGRFAGYFEHWELQLEVEAGLTPMQAILGATKNAAEFLKAKDLGTLEPAKWADLIVLTKNPLQDIKNSRSIEAVYIAGNRVK
jgi:imidazolonepropionase-like amidohydrolase